MDHSKKQILEKYKDSIVKDLEVEYIIETLCDHSVITYDEKQSIKKEVSIHFTPKSKLIRI